MELDTAMTQIKGEYRLASSQNSRFNSPHEGLAVLQEEYEELKAEVFKKATNRSSLRMRHEAMQVAAMALRFMVDLT